MIFSSQLTITTYGLGIDTTKFKSIQSLVEDEKVDATITGLGGYSGDCMQIAVTNKSTDSAFIWIEGGRILASADSSEQDIFIAKNATLAIAPGASDSTTLFGFCCQASYHAPKKKSKFAVGAMAPAAWIILARFIEKHQFPVGAIQKAVWVLSDDHEIGSVHDDDKNKVDPLKRKLAELKGIKVPWYSFTYKDKEGQVFSDELEYIHGEIDFYLSSHCALSVIIKNQYGENVSYPFRSKMYGAGEYTFNLKQRVEGWESGKYVIWLVQDYNLPITKRTFYIK
jgi:hypothetical protein